MRGGDPLAQDRGHDLPPAPAATAPVPQSRGRATERPGPQAPEPEVSAMLGGGDRRRVGPPTHPPQPLPRSRRVAPVQRKGGGGWIINGISPRARRVRSRRRARLCSSGGGGEPGGSSSMLDARLEQRGPPTRSLDREVGPPHHVDGSIRMDMGSSFPLPGWLCEVEVGVEEGRPRQDRRAAFQECPGAARRGMRDPRDLPGCPGPSGDF